MPNALDEALLRPGRIDRIYKVGYPSKEGRVRTYQGYFAKVKHELTDEQIDKLATITPYYSGAKIKDLVNEALIMAIRDGRDVITWQDVMKAKHLKSLGPPEGVEVDLVRGFAEQVDADVSWTAGGEAELMGELDAGRLDLVVGGLSATSPWSTHAALTRPWTTAPGPDGAPVDHVVATRMCENDLLVELETYLDTAGAP